MLSGKNEAFWIVAFSTAQQRRARGRIDTDWRSAEKSAIARDTPARESATKSASA